MTRRYVRRVTAGFLSGGTSQVNADFPVTERRVLDKDTSVSVIMQLKRPTSCCVSKQSPLTQTLSRVRQNSLEAASQPGVNLCILFLDCIW